MKKTLLITAVLLLTAMVLNAQATIGKTDTPPTIDGTREAAWDSAPVYLALDPHSWLHDGVAAGWLPRTDIEMQSDEDFSLNWSAMWDDTCLYFYLEVMDDTVTTGDLDAMDADTKLWMNDNVEARIGPHFYRFAWNRDDENLQRPSEDQTNPGGFTQVSVEITGGYAVEVMVPWSTISDIGTIGATPDVDSSFTFWLGGSDLDNVDGAAWSDQDGHVHWPFDGGVKRVTLALVAPIDDTPPAMPTGFGAEDISREGATLTWDEAAEDDVKGFRVLDSEGICLAYVHDATTLEVVLEPETVTGFSLEASDQQNLSEKATTSVSNKSATGETHIGMAAAPVVIDGTVDADWDDVPKYPAVNPASWSPSAGIVDDADFSLTWSGLWDADNLYFLFEFKDDVVTTGDLEREDSNAKSWMNDNVEMGIGPYKYRFSYGRDDDIAATNEANTPQGFTQKSMTVEGGYVIEVMIPWSDMVNDSVTIGESPDIDTTLEVWITGADLDNPDGWNWDELEGHLGWTGLNPVVLAATAFVDSEAPAAPANLAASAITYEGATLSWDGVADEDLIGYVIYEGTAPFAYPAGAEETELVLAADTEYSFTVMSFDGQNLSAASDAAVVTTLPAPSPKVIDIDKYTGGFANPFEDFDVWDAQPRYAIERQITGTIDNELDHAAEFSVMWDDDNLYVVTYVIDDEINNSNEDNPWENDAVEIHFDMNNERDGTSTDSQIEPYQADNFQYRLIAYKGEMQTGSTPAPDWTGVGQATWDLEDDDFNKIGFYSEANFPWTSLNTPFSGSIVPEVGLAIGFDIKSGDQDAGEDKNNSMTWSSIENSPHANTSEYGQLILRLGGTGMDKEQVRALSVYPNPASDLLSVSLPDGEMDNLTVSDITGRQVLNLNLNGSNGLVNLDLSELAHGLYFVSVSNNNERLGLAKFIKK